MVMWDEVINEIALEFPDVTLDHMLGKFVLPPPSPSLFGASSIAPHDSFEAFG
jgi:hypothetical protein